MPPYGRWGGWCVWARPPLLAHHIQGDKVWRPGHTDTWPCPGTDQRHAALWSCRGAQTTLLRWGWWHTVFQKRNRNSALCVIASVIKLKHKTILWDLLWEMGNNVQHWSHPWRLIVVITAAFMVCMECTQLLCYSKGARLALWLKGRDRSAHLRKQQLCRELIISDSKVTVAPSNHCRVAP